MKKLLFCLAYLAMSLTQLTGQEQISKNIYFPTDVFTLDDQSENELQQFLSQLDQYTEHDITIVGHTDQDGSDEYNLSLSERRAASVADYFNSKGISSGILDVSYKGEAQLVNHSNLDNLKKQNRRVSIVAQVYKYENVNEFIELLDNENVNKHTINTNNEVELFLNKGTEVSIPKNAFCLEDGTPVDNKNVDLTIKEAFSYMDMIDQQLFTQTEDQILETGGMIYISATKDGQKLNLQEGKSIDLTYPIQKPLKGMELFVPEYQKGSEDPTDFVWKTTGKAIPSVEPKKEEAFKQVDLSPILDYPFDELLAEKPSITFEDMPKFPRAVKKPYPPSDKIYTQEKYKEVYKKYEVALEEYKKDQKTYPARLKEWSKEVDLRKKAIAKHRYALKIYYTQKRVHNAIQRLEEREVKESHDKLLTELFDFLYKPSPNIPFDEKQLVKEAFQDVARDVKENTSLKIFPSSNMVTRSGKYCEDFFYILQAKQRQLETGEFSQDALNAKRASRYVVSTTDLGWINCDRFYDVPQEDKTNLTLANVENGVKCFMVFKNIKSVLRPSGMKDKSFKDIPKGELVTLLALKFMNDKAYIAKHEVTTGSVKKMELDYKVTTLSKLKNIIKNIASE